MIQQIITAKEGKIFSRIHDGFVMGKSIHLGVDRSTGKAREDLPEYYEEIDGIVDVPPKDADLNAFPADLVLDIA